MLDLDGDSKNGMPYQSGQGGCYAMLHKSLDAACSGTNQVNHVLFVRSLDEFLRSSDLIPLLQPHCKVRLGQRKNYGSGKWARVGSKAAKTMCPPCIQRRNWSRKE
jgi:hypothetical protein